MWNLFRNTETDYEGNRELLETGSYEICVICRKHAIKCSFPSFLFNLIFILSINIIYIFLVSNLLYMLEFYFWSCIGSNCGSILNKPF